MVDRTNVVLRVCRGRSREAERAVVDPVMVGSSSTAGLRVSARGVRPRHFEIGWRDGALALLRVADGGEVLVDGTPVRAPHGVRCPAELRFGEAIIRVSSDPCVRAIEGVRAVSLELLETRALPRSAVTTPRAVPPELRDGETGGRLAAMDPSLACREADPRQADDEATVELPAAPPGKGLRARLRGVVARVARLGWRLPRDAEGVPRWSPPLLLAPLAFAVGFVGTAELGPVGGRPAKPGPDGAAEQVAPPAAPVAFAVATPPSSAAAPAAGEVDPPAPTVPAPVARVGHGASPRRPVAHLPAGATSASSSAPGERRASGAAVPVPVAPSPGVAPALAVAPVLAVAPRSRRLHGLAPSGATTDLVTSVTSAPLRQPLTPWKGGP